MIDAIYRRELLGGEELIYDKKALQFAFGVDKNFAIGLGVLIYSIIYHNTDKKLAFHIFTDGLAENDIKRLRSFCQHKNVAMQLYFIAADKLPKLPTGFIWTAAIYYRLLICRELSGKIDTIFYLDGDVLCLNPIEPFSVDDKCIIAAVEDNGVSAEFKLKLLQDDQAEYFNSGNLIMNIKAWEDNQITEQAVERLLTRTAEYHFFDQDVLNQVLAGKIEKIDRKFNFIYRISITGEQEPPADTVFLHYGGSSKPWQAWATGNPLAEVFRQYQSRSPWQDVPIMQPATYKQAKFMARACKRGGRAGLALYWYVKYAIWKVFNR